MECRYLTHRSSTWCDLRVLTCDNLRLSKKYSNSTTPRITFPKLNQQPLLSTNPNVHPNSCTSPCTRAPIPRPASMPPSTAAQTLLSPAELSYLHSSLSLTPPIRSDSRSPTQFRPLIAEPDILPSTNGSARICFADGTEAIVGVKAEVEKSRPTPPTDGGRQTDGQDEDMGEAEEEEEGRGRGRGRGESAWVELTIEIPGCRDDDALSVFLAAMLTEALLATGELPDKLYLNNRFHWHLYIDVPPPPPPLLPSPFPTFSNPH